MWSVNQADLVFVDMGGKKFRFNRNLILMLIFVNQLKQLKLNFINLTGNLCKRRMKNLQHFLSSSGVA